jgi:hypothetical protein
VCEPDAGAVIVIAAVVPPVRFSVPCVTPSTVKVTVPVGIALLLPTMERVAVTASALPPCGEAVAGVRASVVPNLAIVIVTVDEVTLV